MREILFRGKTLTNRWVEGAYYKQEYFYGTKQDAHIIITSKENLTYDQGLDFCIVIPETVGQYTGLTANGTKIFEGDICQIKGISYIDETPFVIEWNNEYCGWFWKDLNYAQANDSFTPEIAKMVKIVGNIHDNPELLKGGAE